MAQPCKVCAHLNRQAVDAAIVASRDSLRAIAKQFGLSKSSLERHRRAHLEPGQDALPQTGTLKPESRADRYRAFVARFAGGKRFSRAEVATWGYDPRELEVFIEAAVERGDLRRS